VRRSDPGQVAKARIVEPLSHRAALLRPVRVALKTLIMFGLVLGLSSCAGLAMEVPDLDAGEAADGGFPDAGAGGWPADAGPPPDAGSKADAGSATDAGSTADAGAGTWQAGLAGTCTHAIPAAGQPVDTSSPTHLVGTGTPASCTLAALKSAVAAGGIITFDCGPAPVTIAVTQTLNLPIDKDTVIDGARKVTLDGQGTTQVLRYESANFRALETRVTLQHLRVINGFVAGSSPIPTAPLPCSQGFNDGEGGALFMRDGNLSVIDCIFEGNRAAPLGPDVGGGAIRLLGSKHGVVIVDSTFRDNHASNGGAVGCLFAELDVYDSVFENDSATGNGANSDDPSKCSVINNGQHEVGSGGNGGALYSDGASVNVTLCGARVVNDAAGTNAFGGGLFFTSNDFGGDLVLEDTTMSGNTGGHWTSTHGGLTNAGTAVGTNARSLAISGSTLQGVP
jgi:hypothetical protein